ncbi:hypothetical protein LAV45_10090, partial [Clostridium sporogenes]|nr:hypothetical protein [Clostridium sporogenes]
PKNYNNIEEKYFKRMIAEGIATNFSPTFSSSTIEDSYNIFFCIFFKIMIFIKNTEVLIKKFVSFAKLFWVST